MRDSRTVRILVVGPLLAATAAMIVFTVLLVWPRYRQFQERAKIEAKVSSIRYGQSPKDVDAIFGVADDYDQPRHFGSDTKSGGGWDFTPYFLRYDWYCLVEMAEPAPDKPRTRTLRWTRVYRLQIPSTTYQPKTKGGQELAKMVQSMTPGGSQADRELAWKLGYVGDFISVLKGETTEDLDIRFELMHSAEAPSRDRPPSGDVPE